jgi:hypothetical protein
MFISLAVAAAKNSAGSNYFEGNPEGRIVAGGVVYLPMAFFIFR